MHDLNAFFKEILNKKLVILGVGSDIRGDDGVGPYLTDRLSILNNDRFLSINGGLVPENFTSDIRKFKPEIVIIIDAALMEKAPGDFELIKINEATGISFSSHSMPLSVLGKYLSSYIGAEVYVLGIQAANLNFGSEMSTKVKETADSLFEIINTCLRGDY